MFVLRLFVLFCVGVHPFLTSHFPPSQSSLGRNPCHLYPYSHLGLLYQHYLHSCYHQFLHCPYFHWAVHACIPPCSRECYLPPTNPLSHSVLWIHHHQKFVQSLPPLRSSSSLLYPSPQPFVPPPHFHSCARLLVHSPLHPKCPLYISLSTHQHFGLCCHTFPHLDFTTPHLICLCLIHTYSHD